jgi:2-polyprenyl-3-methyl-5-hydroxy-6-metoxy-1,4-benzoquinol methylase
MKEFWNQRYAQEAMAYGDAPNAFFKEQIDALAPGRILLPAEGEGRNAVYAASLGWEVWAYDWSEVAREKALNYAAKQGVTIDYLLGSLDELPQRPDFFDAIALIYVHFPDQIRQNQMRLLQSWLKPTGRLLLEGFSKKHPQYQALNPLVGGPKNADQLYDLDDLLTDFDRCHSLMAVAQEIELEEGSCHCGTAHVIRLHLEKL